MATTVLVSEATRDHLAATKVALGAKSMDAAIRQLMSRATPTAQELFRSHRKAVLAVCRKHGLKRLIAFGSRVRDDRTPASDLDLVTDFPSGTSLLDVVTIQDDLGAAFGVRVDLGSIPPAGSRLAGHVREEGVELVPSRAG